MFSVEVPQVSFVGAHDSSRQFVVYRVFNVAYASCHTVDLRGTASSYYDLVRSPVQHGVRATLENINLADAFSIAFYTPHRQLRGQPVPGLADASLC